MGQGPEGGGAAFIPRVGVEWDMYPPPRPPPQIGSRVMRGSDRGVVACLDADTPGLMGGLDGMGGCLQRPWICSDGCCCEVYRPDFISEEKRGKNENGRLAKSIKKRNKAEKSQNTRTKNVRDLLLRIGR